MIDRAALEAKARQLEEAVNETQESLKSKAALAAVAVGVVIVGAYLMGRRKGKKTGGARVEIHKL